MNITNTPTQLDLADPTGGFVFQPGQSTQNARVMLTVIDPELEMPYTHQWNVTVERRMPFNSSLRLTYSGTRGMGFLKYAQDNLPISPLDRPVTVIDHPLNAPAAGFPDLRGVTIDRVAADVNCAGTGLPGLPVNADCPNVVPIANNEVSFRVPRINERRPDPRYTTNLKITNGADQWYNGLQVEWIKRLSALAAVPGGLHLGQGDGHALRSDFRSGRRHESDRTRLAVLARPRAVRHASPLHVQRQLSSPVLRGSPRSDRTDARRLAGVGVVKLVSGTPFTVIDGRGPRPQLRRLLGRQPSGAGRSVDSCTRRSTIPRRRARPCRCRRSEAPQFGDTELVGRNTFFGDGTNIVDLGLYKSFALPSNHRVLLRLEMYNAFNQVQFNFPARAIDTPATFGRSPERAPYTTRVWSRSP